MTTYSTTVTVIAQADMQDPMEGFVMRKIAPTARLTMAMASQEHTYTRDQETHAFTVTADLREGEHEITFQHTRPEAGQGALLIRELRIQGAPIGLPVYRGVYTRHDTHDRMPGHLYMGWPGPWTYSIRVPAHWHDNGGGIGFE